MITYKNLLTFENDPRDRFFETSHEGLQCRYNRMQLRQAFGIILEVNAIICCVLDQ